MKRMCLTLRSWFFPYWERSSYGGSLSWGLKCKKFDHQSPAGTKYELETPSSWAHIFSPFISISSPSYATPQCQIYCCITSRSKEMWWHLNGACQSGLIGCRLFLCAVWLSHIDNFDSRDDGLGVSAYTTNVLVQSSVFDLLPISAELDFQPAVQPQNETAFLQSGTPVFMVSSNKGLKPSIETDRDLLPDWELQEVSYFLSNWLITNNKCNSSQKPRWNMSKSRMRISFEISQVVQGSQPNGTQHWDWWSATTVHSQSILNFFGVR